MYKVRQRDVWHNVATSVPFILTTGNMRGELVKTDDEYIYYIFSYAEMIGWIKYDIREDGLLGTAKDAWLTKEKFSVTTSKHTNYARRGITYVMGTEQQ